MLEKARLVTVALVHAAVKALIRRANIGNFATQLGMDKAIILGKLLIGLINIFQINFTHGRPILTTQYHLGINAVAYFLSSL